MMGIKDKIQWGIINIGLLGVSYVLCRFLFFQLHGMKQWTNLLAILSAIVILLFTVMGSKTVPLTAVLGYVGGFIVAMIFNTDGVDFGGGKINNAWIIWGAVLIISILSGIVLDLIFKHYAKVKD